MRFFLAITPAGMNETGEGAVPEDFDGDGVRLLDGVVGWVSLVAHCARLVSAAMTVGRCGVEASWRSLSLRVGRAAYR